jgi:hypothetical protein
MFVSCFMEIQSVARNDKGTSIQQMVALVELHV